MNRQPSSPNPRAVRLLVALVACVAIASPASARIGIGNPVKKMKEKIQNKAEGKAAPEATDAAGPPAFDDVTLELTDARIAGIIDAYQKSKKIAAGRAPLNAKRNQLMDERNKLNDREGDRMRELRGKRGDVEQCYQGGYRAAADKKAEEYKNRALSDPALRDKFTKAAMQYNEAAAKGDSSAIQKLQGILTGEILPSKEDSAAVRASCGPMPPKSAAEIKDERLSKDIDAVDEQIREIDEEVSKVGNGGLNPQQWGTALERIQLYVQGKKAKKEPKMYTDQEIRAIEKRLAELEEAMGI
ncbi:MAG TPA: hypothetical protein VL503_11910 [Candidatus Omnitrophota bacterium]|nr:hypothetical protein [Candidatus Omnitrophota bacterium]